MTDSQIETLTRAQLPDAFREGVRRTTEERWVDPAQIENAEIRSQYQALVDAHDVYSKKCAEFQEVLSKIDEG